MGKDDLRVIRSVIQYGFPILSLVCSLVTMFYVIVLQGNWNATALAVRTLQDRRQEEMRAEVSGLVVAVREDSARIDRAAKVFWKQQTRGFRIGVPVFRTRRER